jgi:predicted NUDIX family NTP pyrophosphohydrolase
MRRVDYCRSMSKVSAGLVMYRVRNGHLEFLLAHPGGSFWKNKDAAAWTIPKGEIHPDEEPLAAARREFQEETGFVPEGNFIALTAIKQRSGKVVHAWAFEGNCDPAEVKSNTFQMEWPPRSGRLETCPEIDRADFFNLSEAKIKIIPAQFSLLAELEEKLRTLPAS